MTQDTSASFAIAERNKRLVLSHLKDFVNRTYLAAIDHTMADVGTSEAAT